MINQPFRLVSSTSRHVCATTHEAKFGGGHEVSQVGPGDRAVESIDDLRGDASNQKLTQELFIVLMMGDQNPSYCLPVGTGGRAGLAGVRAGELGRKLVGQGQGQEQFSLSQPPRA